MATNFITNTASLKTTIADVRKLNAKKIFLGGENILEIIKKATPTIKHSQDTRETVTENDLWGQYIETTSDGTIIVHDDWVTNPNAFRWKTWNTSLTKVEDNKVYVGDTLYGNIQTERIKDGTYMFSKSNIKSFTSDLFSLIDGDNMFSECSNLTTFSSDSIGSPVNLSNLTNGNLMFYYCENLESFSYGLSSMTNGEMMFQYCTNLESFPSDLSSLMDGFSMFNSCSNLTSFNIDLPSLTNGGFMFQLCENLESFSSNLSSLTNGGRMFEGCYKLTTFSSDLSSLIDSDGMFGGCKNLTSFTSDLSSLINGQYMFSKCKLDAESVMYIADTIKDIDTEKQLYIDGTIPYVTEDTSVWPYKYSAPKGFMSNGKYVFNSDTYDIDSKHVKPYAYIIYASDVGKLTLGINVTNDATTIQQQLEDFAKEASFDSWEDLKTHFSNKGWTVTFQYGGTDTSITYGLRGGEQKIPCPIFAKLIEIEPQGVEYDKDGNVIRENFYSDKQITRASYCNEDASIFYNIEWGHDVTDTSSYNQFDSLEDAMASWNVFPKENIITNEE